MAEIFEIAPGRWGYRVDGVYQEYDPALPGFAPMDRARATECASALAEGDAIITQGVPSPITARQIRLALNRAGLRDAVDAAVAAGPLDLRDWWEYSTEVHRDNPLVVQMIDALGIDAAAADALWRLGAGL